MRACFRRLRQLRLKSPSIFALAVVVLLGNEAALAEQLAAKQLGIRAGDATLQLRAGLGSVADADQKLGAVLQPRIESSTRGLGRLFTGATAFGIVNRPAGEEPGIMLVAPRAIGLHQLYAGWSSAMLLGGLGEDAVTVSFGREVVEDGTGTIGWEMNQHGCDAACWIRRRPTEIHTTTLTLKVRSIQGRVFLARDDVDELARSHAGVEAKLTATPLLLAGGFVSANEEIRFGESGGHGFAEAGYDFTDLLHWSPKLIFRYHFIDSGNGNGDTAGDQVLAPLLRTIASSGDLPPITRGSASDLRLVFRPRDHLGIELLYLHAFASGRHDLRLYAEHGPTDGMSLRVGGSVSLGEHDGRPLAFTTAEESLEAVVSLSF